MKQFYFLIIFAFTANCQSTVKTDPTIAQDTVVDKGTSTIRSIVGKWEIIQVTGKIFVQPNPGGPKVPAPMNIMEGKHFQFNSDGTVHLLDGKKRLSVSRYELDQSGLKLFAWSEEHWLNMTWVGDELTIEQTADNYFLMLHQETKIPLSKLKEMYQIEDLITYKLKPIS